MSTSWFFFHDTGVLINFSLCGEMDLLEQILGQRGRWTGTVSIECERVGPKLSLPDPATSSERILGEPIMPHDGEHQQIRSLRQLMAAPGDHQDEHLGEAETLTIIRSRQLKAVFVTEDYNAHPFADGTRCIDTWQLLRVALKRGLTSRENVRRFRAVLLDNGRISLRRKPEIFLEQRFEKWLASTG
ncbi:hypothetical protein M3B11_07940 [Brevibacterium sp. p3-SID960]|uniref:hypothetical protein n=1 Tax=Brevibacterium sp. p3-SID960 TaxID=2916063 RepID=UPI0021A6F99D|nr:hypothetical protein [Brevibacterium sp. p3-SID960]MCT1690886.1 hypothetical protein [Brevibacterium sp. p3-SID960]